jgi:molybdopterin-guanine dinucleotide biosynthesis protein A
MFSSWAFVITQVAGLLLTGGASRRMGVDKTRILLDGRRLAEVVGEVLGMVASPVIEVGQGVTRFKSLREDPSGEGPLAAIAAGWDFLREQGLNQPALVVAADLPLISPLALRLLAEWPGNGSVVPVVAGIAQPLCARWSVTEMISARERLTQTRSVRFLASAPDTVVVEESMWRHVVDASVFADVDYPEDFERLNLSWSAPTIEGPEDRGS